MSQSVSSKPTYRDFIANRQFSEAINMLQSEAEKNPTPANLCDLGVVYAMSGDGDKAVACFEKAMEADPRSALARARLAETLAMNGYLMQAVEYMGQATNLEPGNAEYKQKFLALLTFGEQKKFNPLLKKKISEILETPGVDLSEVGHIWYSVLKLDPGFRDIHKAGMKPNYDTFIKTLARLNSNERSGFSDAYFLTGLRALTLYDTGFETFVGYLRRMLLDGVRGEHSLVPPEQSLNLAAALAHYCFFVEYVPVVEAAEQTAVDALARTVETSATPGALALAVLACYRPLGSLANAAAIAAGDLLGDPGLIKLQITDAQVQEKLRATVKTVTSITDDVSQKVRAQYEDFPYPRWRYYSTFMKEPAIEGRFTDRAARILVAGCGTGREAIELAACFPDSEVTAIDLSTASLSYGMRMAQEAGIDNIRFAQGDLQELGPDAGLFDYIASSGVLHHMNDPLKGWGVLESLLKPGGLMRIALYSRKARRPLAAARQVIRANGFENTADGIRNFRAQAPALLTREVYDGLRAFGDYYTTSECRDLLFHVHEHEFDLGQVKAALDGMGLVFEHFYLPHAVTVEYMKKYRDDPAASSLANWAAFEEINPGMFTAMYRFWCTKPL